LSLAHNSLGPRSQDLFQDLPHLPFHRFPRRWRFGLIEAPACTEHFKYLQRYFKKRFWHVLFLFPEFPYNCCCSPACCWCVCVCVRVQRSLEFPSPFQLVECFAHFSVVGTKKGKPNFECGMGAALQLCVCDGVFVGGALEGACVLLGKCQKPLVKKPYGNYSTQLNMKCGDGKRRECGGKKNKKKSCSAGQIMKNTPTSVFSAVCTQAHTNTHSNTHFCTLFMSCRCSLCCCCCCALAAAWQFFGDKIFKFN